VYIRGQKGLLFVTVFIGGYQGGLMRIDGRKTDELRSIRITRNYLKGVEGSALIEMGNTKVLCAATVQESVPPFSRARRGLGHGGVRCFPFLRPADRPRTSKVGGAPHEIQRLIGGRSARWWTEAGWASGGLIDCDVIQADGGTRTASITGAYIALADAIRYMHKKGMLTEEPLLDHLAAVSVGIVDGKPMLDLCYEEDSEAEVDMNLVMTGAGGIVEVQGTAEGEPFSKAQLTKLLALGEKGIKALIRKQRESLGKHS
jgi:ribonuclease PH